MSKTLFLRLILACLLIADIAYTFRQNYGKPLDGDLAPIVLPSLFYEQVLKDPLGFRAIAAREHYAAPNRYFSHESMRIWFRPVYFSMSVFFKDPVQRLYVAAALFNTMVQVVLIFLLSVYITGHARFWQLNFLFAACLVTPFFEIHGFYESIAVVDGAITYTFFYAFPLAVLLLYILPFYLAWYNNKPLQFKTWMCPIWVFLAFFLAFSGPLIAPLMLLCCFLGLAIFIIDTIRLSKNVMWEISVLSVPVKFNVVLVVLLCSYSYFLGKYNVENVTELSFADSYRKLWEGVKLYFSRDLALILMLLILLINYLVSKIKNIKLPVFTKSSVAIIMLFVVVYILLLPLGGYRIYRPQILRYDTFMPVTLLLIFCIGYSSYVIIQSVKGKSLYAYLLFIIAVLGYYTISDEPRFNDNLCQQNSLYKLRASDSQVTYLGNECTELNWWVKYDTTGTRNISEMLFQWGITDKFKPFAGEP